MPPGLDDWKMRLVVEVCFWSFGMRDKLRVTKSSETTPFGKVDAIEPPLFVVSICKGFLLKQSLREIWCWKTQRFR